MNDWLAARAAASPQTLALLFGEEQWTYGALDTAVSHLAAHLHQHGIRPGDIVAALLPNSPLYVCLIHALARLGAVLVPLNTRLTPAELQWQIDRAAVKWLVYHKTFRETAEILDNCQWLMVNSPLSMKEEPLTINNWQFTIEKLQAVVFTSGTSGRPKGAMLTFANHYWSAMASAYRLEVHSDDRWLSVLPLYHVGGLAVIFRSCLYGTAVILHRQFDLVSVNHSLDNDLPTLISLVPTMLYRLLQSRDHWPASLRLILLGGAAATPALIEQANGLPRKLAMVNGQSPIVNEEPLAIDNWQFAVDNPPPLVAPTYGLTEAASQVATMPPEEAARKPGSVGKPLLFTSVQIVGDDGKALPSGEIGEIVVTGPTVMAGYFEQERKDFLAAPLSRSPAPLHTGDLGYLDGDGDLWVVQRRSDLIVTGGENVYPAEVEAVLRAHTAVKNACVIPLSHPEWGQQVAAMVQTEPETAVSVEDLLSFCRIRLAGYKLPRTIKLVNQLPLTASGKIHRRAVIKQMQTAHPPSFKRLPNTAK